jgi:ATP-dependent DNA helicase RecG C-terminal
MPTASAYPSFTNCAGASAAARTHRCVPPASCSTGRRSARPPGRASPSTEDGFRIAEEDLRLRGEGDVLGIRQSGLPGFRIARPAVHLDLMVTARDDAALVLARDPGLTGERGQALRVLLYLFERDEAVRLIGAG